ncbi:cytochrome C biogenesis protein CcmA, partial [Vibrio xuii]
LFESLSFTIGSGELVQIEGRNGTGKTTLLRIVTGLGDRDTGEIFWNGENIESNRDAYHEDLLFLGHSTGVKRDLTAYENLRFYLSVHSKQSMSKEEIYSALVKVGLAGREDVPVAQLSAGQQRRVALA